MKNVALFLLLFCSYFIGNTQVGINNTNPNAVLDIRSSNQASPSITDGILIPKINNFSAVNPGVNQDGMLVYATGSGIPAKGFYYWNNTTTSWVSFAGSTGNTLNDAYNEGGAGAGRIITATNGAVTIAGEDGLLVTGLYGSGDVITASGEGARMFFNPRKAAFRAGHVAGNQWDDAQVGDYSFAVGNTNQASGYGSAAFGRANSANGVYTAVFGENNSAEGFSSFVVGTNNITLGETAVAIGQSLESTNDNSVIIGNSITADGQGNIAIGNGLRTFSADEMAFGKYNTIYTPANNNSDRLLVVGNGTAASRNNAMMILKNGNVGFGESTPIHPLQMGSGAHVTSAGVWTNASDARLKENIFETKYGLEEVLKLRPVNYTMIADGSSQVGFIAQELREIIPEVVSGTEGDINKGETLGVSYGNIVPVLVKAVQELSEKLDILEKENQKLQEQLNSVQYPAKQ